MVSVYAVVLIMSFGAARGRLLARGVVKNIFGRGVSMSTLLQESERLLPLWGLIHHRIEEFRRASYPSLSTDERDYP